MRFVARPEYIVWVFWHAVMSCVVTVSIIPLWIKLFIFVSEQMIDESPKANRTTIFNLVLSGFVLIVIIFAVLGFITSRSSHYFDQSDYIPQNLYTRFYFIYGYTTFAALPALLGIFSIHTATQKTSVKIDLPEQTKEDLFELRDDLLHYRSLLQVYLLIAGIILSMASITGVAYREIFVGLGASGIEKFPISHALSYGGFFTILLLLVYTPVHISLTETSQKLRDAICPITSVETLPEVIAQRKYLDEMLHINGDLISNFRDGFMALAPFVSSLFASVIGNIQL